MPAEPNWFVKNLLVWSPIDAPESMSYQPECRQCGYCLKGLQRIDEPRCPECGAMVPAEWFVVGRLHPSWLLKILSAVYLAVAVAALATLFAGFHCSANGEFHPESRRLSEILYLVGVVLAAAGLVLGIGMLTVSPLSRRHRSTHLLLWVCLACFALSGCCFVHPLSYS